jgi:predicted nucleotidyltransferase
VEASGKTSVEALLDCDEFVRKLHEFGVPNALIDEAWMIVKGRALGVLLYGSWARRQAGVFSDLDLLLLSDVRVGTRKTDRVSVTFYSSIQLGDAHCTLYGMHLARDGVILHDTGELARILSTFSPPDPADLLRRVREFAIILDVTDEDLSRYLPGLAQVARYLLRTATYAVALRDGDPCFSIDELAIRFDQPELVILLSSHPGVYPEPAVEVLADITQRLTSVVGPLPANGYKSLHALIVATSVTDPEVSHLATFVLGNDDSLPYAEIPKVVL